MRPQFQLLLPLTFIAGHIRTFMAAPTPIMAMARLPQVLSQALQSVPRQRPHTTTLSPTTHRTVIRPTRRDTPRVVHTRPLAQLRPDRVTTAMRTHSPQREQQTC